MKKSFEIISGVIILIFMGVVLWQIAHQSTVPEQPVACSAEAKLCPDGSAVGRTGPNCEFAECQSVDPNKNDLTGKTKEFQFALEELVRIEIGQPIEGYEPMMFMQVLPGILPEDFNDVDAAIGVYKYRNGELKHEIPQDILVHSAAPAITEEGVKTLFENITHRLDLDTNNLSVDNVVKILERDESNPVEPEPTPSPNPEPVACTMDAKQCPDGSFVGRVGPDCEFKACPESEFPIWYGEDSSRLEEYRSDCESKMGKFNECASACDNSTDPNVSCAAVCSMVCEGPALEHVPPDLVTEIKCSPEEKQAELCTMEYAPVCGLVQVQCFTTPCNPVPETFSNSCNACSQGNVVSYTEGECES